MSTHSGAIRGGKKEQIQANTAGSNVYAEEKLQDIQLQRLCVCSLISVIKEQKKTHAFKYAS